MKLPPLDKWNKVATTPPPAGVTLVLGFWWVECGYEVRALRVRDDGTFWNIPMDDQMLCWISCDYWLPLEVEGIEPFNFDESGF